MFFYALCVMIGAALGFAACYYGQPALAKAEKAVADAKADLKS